MSDAAYLRVSSKHKQGDRWSLPAQREAIARHCAAQGRPEPIWYVETHTAKEDDPDARPVFRKLLTDAARRMFTSVIVVDVDRFARSPMAGLIAASRLEKVGVTVVSLNDGNIDIGDPDGEFNFTLKLMFARRENKHRARKVRAGQGAAKAAGHHITQPPYGARIGEDRRLALHPETAPILARILREAARDTADAIAARLTDEGVPPPGARMRETRWGTVGTYWWPNAILRMIDHGAWLQAFPDPWPALWRAARDRPRKPHVRAGLTIRMLTGLCRCACGGTISYNLGRGNRPGFNCRNLARGGTGFRCPIPRTAAAHYEALVLAEVLALPEAAEDREIIAAADPAAWAEVAEDRRRLDVRYERKLIDDGQLLAALADIERREASLPRGEVELERWRAEIAPLLARFATLEAADQNRVLRWLVEAIIIDGRTLTMRWRPEARAVFRLPEAA